MAFCTAPSGEGPLRLVNFDDLLYPQYESKFQRTLSADVWDIVQTKAQKLLETSGKSGEAAPQVIAHWATLAAGKLPFGLELEFVPKTPGEAARHHFQKAAEHLQDAFQALGEALQRAFAALDPEVIQAFLADDPEPATED